MEICTTCNCAVKLNARIKELCVKMFMGAAQVCIRAETKPHLDAKEINLFREKYFPIAVSGLSHPGSVVLVVVVQHCRRLERCRRAYINLN